MKNKFSALIATLIFTSPFSCAPFSFAMETNFGHIDYDLWNVSTNAVNLDEIKKKRLEYERLERERLERERLDQEEEERKAAELKARIRTLEAMRREDEQRKADEAWIRTLGAMRRETEQKELDQMGHLNTYSNDTDVIDVIDGFDPYLHKYLDRFIKNPKVKHFKDYLGREYTDIPLPAVVSRFGNLGFGSSLSYSKEEFNGLRNVFVKVTDIYIKRFPPVSPIIYGNKRYLNDRECLREKTKFIHFIEDVIIKLNSSIKIRLEGYNRLLAAFNLLCNKGYQELVLGSWEDYLDGTEDLHLSKLFSDEKKRNEIASDLEKFINESNKQRKNHYSNKNK